MLTRQITKLTPILVSILTQVPDRDDRSQRIVSARRHGWVEPCGGMDIKTGIGGQAQIANDTFEVFAVIVCKEKRMWAKGFIRLIHSPKETDHRAGIALTRKSFRLAIIWK